MGEGAGEQVYIHTSPMHVASSIRQCPRHTCLKSKKRKRIWMLAFASYLSLFSLLVHPLILLSRLDMRV